jgi:hypothetical protein
MRLVARKVWTNGRKWVGNLVPALFFLPFVAWGVHLMLKTDQILGSGLWFVAIGVLLGWIGLNIFGLSGNAFMRRELKRNLVAKNVSFDDPHFFVGFSSPRFFGVLDAHEDIGFLFLHEESLEFVGELNQVKIGKAEIQQIRFRPNVHTWVGLGRWISIDGQRKKSRFRMNVEPREKNFLLLNLLGSRAVKEQLRAWAAKAN